MSLQAIQLADFRCFRQIELELDPSLTLITGPNGAGKTSVLEGIYLLGRGRSFRTSQTDSLVRLGADQFRVVGSVSRNGRGISVGLQWASRRLEARIAGAPAESLAELTVTLPVQVIEPGIHQLIEGGPLRRRRFVDWGVFHVEPRFLFHWQRFHRALRQRNAVLREQEPDDALEVWTRELIVSGEHINQARINYVLQLLPHIGRACSELLGEEIAITYVRGWPDDQTLEEALTNARARDRQRQTTTVGPHRADLAIRRLSRTARQTVSRGQQKLLAAALVLGQLQLHAVEQSLRTTLLLDDPAAELDAMRLDRLVAQVRELPVQLVITALHDDFRRWGSAGRLFHVEQGGGMRML